MKDNILEKINNCGTMPELDSLRLEAVKIMETNKENFKIVQNAFIKKQNKLKRNW